MIREETNHLKTSMLENLEILENESWKRQGPEKKTQRAVEYRLEILNMGSISLENMKWKFGIEYGIHIQKAHEMGMWY